MCPSSRDLISESAEENTSFPPRNSLKPALKQIVTSLKIFGLVVPRVWDDGGQTDSHPDLQTFYYYNYMRPFSLFERDILSILFIYYMCEDYSVVSMVGNYWTDSVAAYQQKNSA